MRPVGVAGLPLKWTGTLEAGTLDEHMIINIHMLRDNHHY